MQRERQEETEHDELMEENAGPLLISKLEVQQHNMVSSFVNREKAYLLGYISCMSYVRDKPNFSNYYAESRLRRASVFQCRTPLRRSLATAVHVAV